MTKQCQKCECYLDESSFNGSSREPDGMSKTCRSCVNRRRREIHAGSKSDAGREESPRLEALVKQGNIDAVKRHSRKINAGNREALLELAVRDFRSAPKKPGHVSLIKYLIKLGARPDYRLVCAATVGPHLDILNALIEAEAEQNLFTAAAMGDVELVRRLLNTVSPISDSSPGPDPSIERHITALHYACMSELSKLSENFADQLYRCVELLLDKRLTRLMEVAETDNSLDLCASLGGNVRIAQLLIANGWRPTISTVLGALGHTFRHGRGNYEVAALCREAGVDINEFVGTRSLLHAFAHQGDFVGTRWLVDNGATIDARDGGNNTPLHKACERNTTVRVTELLVKHGASLTSVNNNGQTPRDVAIQNDKRNVAKYLECEEARQIGNKGSRDSIAVCS